MKKVKIFYFLAIGLASFLACVGIVQATQTFTDAIAVPSLKVGSQGSGGVTFFNGTIVNETTDSEGNGIPITFGDDVRIDGTIYRGATAGPGDSYPLKLYDDVIVYGDLTVNGSSPFISSLSAGSNVSVTNNNDGTWTIAATDTDTDTDTLAGLSCSTNQVAKYNGSAWACAEDVDTDTDTDTDTNTGTLSFFISGQLSSGYGPNLDGTYLSGWKPTSGQTLAPQKVTINAQTPPLGAEIFLGLSDDGGSNYDMIALADGGYIASSTSFAVFDAITNDNGLTIQYTDGGATDPQNINIIIEYSVQ